jgi:pyruvate formate lyase activating enzyme
VIGKRHTPEALASLLLRDRAFFSQSGGGVTLSGGEPALFPQYLSQLLPLLKRESVHVLLQTSAHFPDYDEVRRAVLPYVDTIDVSLKFADAQAHQLFCGSDNTLILANLRRLAAEPHIEVEVSIPLVPGVTATDDNLRALSAIVRDVGIHTVRLLPYNPLWAHISPAVARCTAVFPRTFMKPEEIAWAKAVLVEHLTDAAATGQRSTT